MTEPRTLDNIYQLNVSGFGRPWRRHGLKLLYWFANDCVSFHDMLLECEPWHGAFGFHQFENRYERNGTKLLPDVDLEYYEVGNLHKSRAIELPDYVREDNTGYRDQSNTDRLIISVDDEFLGDVYVTNHVNRSNFNSNVTFRISRALLISITGLTLDDFLEKAGYQGKPGTKPAPFSQPTSTPLARNDTVLDMERVSQRSNVSIIVENPHVEENRCSCTIL